MKFTTPERLKDYILLHIEDDLIIFVQNGYVVVDVNNDGVFSLVSLKFRAIKTLIESLESLFSWAQLPVKLAVYLLLLRKCLTSNVTSGLTSMAQEFNRY